MTSEDTALFMLHEALHDLHGLSCVFRSEEDETSFDLVHAARAHIDKAVAALESDPPCACGGKEPIAEVGGWINKDDPFHLQEDLKLTPHVPHKLHISGLRGERSISFATRVQMETPVRILVFDDLPGGKPNDE